MRRLRLPLAAVVAFAGLVVTVVAVAVSSASGTPGGGLGASPPRTGSGIQRVPPPACVLMSVAVESTPANPPRVRKSTTAPMMAIGLVKLIGAILAVGKSAGLRFAPQRLQ